MNQKDNNNMDPLNPHNAAWLCMFMMFTANLPSRDTYCK